jgi:hypothetical protein
MSTNIRPEWVFFRKSDDGKGEMFYFVQPSPRCKPEDHASLNPGTLRIEEALTGKLLWAAPSKKETAGEAS